MVGGAAMNKQSATLHLQSEQEDTEAAPDNAGHHEGSIVELVVDDALPRQHLQKTAETAGVRVDPQTRHGGLTLQQVDMGRML